MESRRRAGGGVEAPLWPGSPTEVSASIWSPGTVRSVSWSPMRSSNKASLAIVGLPLASDTDRRQQAPIGRSLEFYSCLRTIQDDLPAMNLKKKKKQAKSGARDWDGEVEERTAETPHLAASCSALCQIEREAFVHSVHTHTHTHSPGFCKRERSQSLCFLLPGL